MEVGQTVNDLTLLESHGTWGKFQCACGKTVDRLIRRVRHGDTKDCGCKRGKRISESKKKYSFSDKLKRTYNSIIQRCTNPKQKSFKYYGGKNPPIKVCERWLDSMEHFAEDMGDPPTDKHTIERLDSNGDYEPDNCIWALRVQQSRNKSDNVNLTWNGHTKTAAEWSAQTGIDVKTIYARHKRGWDANRIFTTPVKKQRKHVVTFQGQETALKEACKLKGISYNTVMARILDGMSAQEAFDLPIESKPVYDYVGKNFGEWKVIESLGKGKWKCLCSCGTERAIHGQVLRDGKTLSCGCKRSENISKTKSEGSLRQKHPRLYATYHQLKGKCYNPNHESYPNHGGAGLTICQRWLDSFEAFIEDMGDAPSDKHFIHRIDLSKGFTPDNCEWRTGKPKTL